MGYPAAKRTSSAAPTQFNKLVQALIAGIDAAVSLKPAATGGLEPDMTNHLNIYQTALQNKQNIVVVAHSQGNLYVNEAYDLLFPPPSSPEQNLFHVIAVATPADHVAGGGHYTTLYRDPIWQMGSLANLIIPTPPSLTWNADNGPCIVAPSPDKGCHPFSVLTNPFIWTFHSFTDSYLGGNASDPCPSASDSQASPGASLSCPLILNEIVSAIMTRVSVAATLDGLPWPSSGTGAVSYGIVGPNINVATTGAVPEIIPNLPNGTYTLTYNSGGPPNSTLKAIAPCGLFGTNPIPCSALGNAGQTITFTLQFSTNPPSAGFSIAAGGQSATEGQTLNLTVPPGGTASVTFDGSARSTAYNGRTITGWQWTIDGVNASTATSFVATLGKGTHPVTLVVTDNLGSNSAPVQGNVSIMESVSVPAWIHLTPSGGPNLNGNTPVYDPASNHLILFGGFAGGPCCTGLSNTWIITNANGTGGIPQWQLLAPKGSFPPGRASHSAVYDQATNSMIIFGGANGDCGAFCTLFNDVWVLQNANGAGGTPTWTQLNPSVPNGTPPPRSGHRAVYDPNTNRMIIFGGGNDGLNDRNDTWVLSNANGLDGTPQWMPIAPSGVLPAPREIHMQTYDPGANVMTVFGGGPCCTFLGDLWLLTHANGLGGTPAWQQVTQTSPAPGPVANFNQGYDPSSNTMIFFGGSTNFGVFRNDAWVLQNASGVGGTPTWLNTIPNGAPGSPPAGAPLGAYDPVRKRLMIFPDTADLWVLQQ
jgi:hypothetical protein